MAKAHNLGVALALGVEVRAALAAAHGQRRQAVFQHLLETKEFENAERHRGMKTHPSLVRTDRVVELHTPGAVHPKIPLIILPSNAEDDDPIRLGHAFENLGLSVFGMLKRKRNDRVSHFLNSLVKLGLPRITLDQPVHEFIDLCVAFGHSRHRVLLMKIQQATQRLQNSRKRNTPARHFRTETGASGMRMGTLDRAGRTSPM